MLFKKYKSRVIKVANPIEGIHTAEFAPDRGKYKYKPGQFLHLAIDPNYDGVGQWPDSRCFSMQSSPEESTIRVTYAVKGAFTTAMCDYLKPGKIVWLKMPYGDLFTRVHSKENTVFISGGTGITPFLSLFTHESFNDYINPKIYLGFRSKAYDIYQNEINRLCNSSKYVKTFYQDVDGLIDIQLILSQNGKNSNYLVSGPPSMIKSIRYSLIEHGVNLENIITDDWE
ncbi:MAG: FAD-dependent oxidoreductase [Bacteroidetes bacterium]|jgi:ferredoxin-NADP reductase|nr:FAD-dependent oxidoreductase [Bacteroidota bacterium]